MTIKEMGQSYPFDGEVKWIGLRPEKKGVINVVEEASLNKSSGIEGDHYSGLSGKRQVTLIQEEHLSTVASLLHRDRIDPTLTRRNIVVSGINLNSFTDKKFAIGDEVVLKATGPCHPCSRMEENLGFGGHNAMRGMGGITARVVNGGTIRLGDQIRLFDKDK